MMHEMEDELTLWQRIRPLIAVLVATMLFVGGVVLLYRGSSIMITSLYDNKNNKEEFVCTGSDLYHLEHGERVPLTVKSIAVEPDAAEHVGDWSRVIDVVASAGANTVLAQDIMPPAFYRELKAHNEAAGNGLMYLIQRVRLGEGAYEGMVDLIDDQVAQSFLEKGKRAIDVVRGCRLFGGYTSDVSAYTMGFCLGDDWDPGLLASTQLQRAGDEYGYIGMYFTCTSSFTPVEASLAKTMDALISYEIGKYNHRTPLGVWNHSVTDEVGHVPALLRDYSSIATFTQSCIAPTDKCEVGTFVCYSLADESLPEIALDRSYASKVKKGDASSMYAAYVADTVLYAEGPVIVCCRASSGRGALGSDEGHGVFFGASDEDGQGKRYQSMIGEAFASGVSGFCLPLLDDVDAVSWNTDDVSENNGLWRNAQNPEQYCGIVAMDDASVWTVDGDDAEWEGVDPVCTADGASLKVAYDSEYLYLCVGTKGFDRTRDRLVIPFDVTPISGAPTYGDSLSFDRDADFVLDLSGDAPELLVQRYYNYFWALQTLTHREMTQPARDEHAFGTIYQYTREHDYLSDGHDVKEVESVYYPTGGLVSGRDYVVGSDCVELRVAWALLNFFDPSSRTILGDYYESESPDERLLVIDSLYVGLCLNGGSRTVRLSEVPLAGWTKVNWTVREKASFALVKEAFDAIQSK